MRSGYNVRLCLLAVCCTSNLCLLLCILITADNQVHQLNHKEKNIESESNTGAHNIAAVNTTLPSHIHRQMDSLKTSHVQNLSDDLHSNDDNIYNNQLLNKRITQVFSNITVTNLFENNHININYPYFNNTHPLFINEADRLIFHSDPDRRKDLGEVKMNQLRGHILMIPRSSVSESHHCGWDTDIRVFSHRSLFPARGSLDQLVVPLLVPEGGTFQHFVDGVLPKIMQVYPIIQQLKLYTLLIHKPKDPVVMKIIEELGIPKSAVQFYHGGLYKTSRQINTCLTPPMHPVLWHSARQLLLVHHSNSARKLIILITRQKAISRRMVNLAEVVSGLQAEYDSRLVTVEDTMSFTETRHIFSSAIVIIGVHGGALYNMLFCPTNTTVIEVVSTIDRRGRTSKTISANIFWHMAASMGHTYWRIYSPATNPRMDVRLDLDSLLDILKTVVS